MIQVRVNREERLLVLRYAGTLAVEDWRITMSRALETYPEIVTFDSLVDVRSLETAPSAEEMRRHARDVKALGFQSHRRRTAVIVASAIHFGLSRMFELMTESERDVERMTTASLASAAEYLGRPEGLIQAELEAVARTDGDVRALA